MAGIPQTILVLLLALAIAVPVQVNAAVQIIVYNMRNSSTIVHCCSGGPDLCQSALLPGRYWAFSFTPSIIGNTVYNCRATYAVIIDPNVPTIKTVHQSWPAYKESPGNPHESTTFEIMDDGIYWAQTPWLKWDETNVYPPNLPPLCSQHPIPCEG